MEKPICGAGVRLEWLKNEFYCKSLACINAEELKDLAGWYLSEGLRMGFNKNLLLENIKDNEKLKNICDVLTEQEISRGKIPPVFREGDEVEVIVNAKNLTYHRGCISQIIYHGNEKEWFYHICENGKKVGKRYFERDLKKFEMTE